MTWSPIVEFSTFFGQVPLQTSYQLTKASYQLAKARYKNAKASYQLSVPSYQPDPELRTWHAQLLLSKTLPEIYIEDYIFDM